MPESTSPILRDFTVLGIRDNASRCNLDYIAFKRAINGFSAMQEAVEDEHFYGRHLKVFAVYEGHLSNKLDDTTSHLTKTVAEEASDFNDTEIQRFIEGNH